MSIITPGLVHAPVIPFKRDNSIDFETFEKMIAFHLRNGAEALAVSMHAGESVSLTNEEQLKVIDFTIKQTGGRVPVIANASDPGTAIAAARARDAEAAGAAAVVATAPYYWTPPPAMLVEHFAQIGSAVRVPFFVHYAPSEVVGPKLTNDIVLKLIDRLENFAGFVDASQDWQFMTSMIMNAKRRRPEFQLLTGIEYLVSAGAIGATGMFSSLSGIAPRLVRRLYDICRQEKYFEARKPQEEISVLHQVIKGAGFAGLKGAMRAMGRDCGEPRRPVIALGTSYEKLAAEINALAILREEPRGW